MVRLSDALGAAAAALAVSVTKFLPYEAGRKGLPALNVLYTSDQAQGLSFLRSRLDVPVLSLDIQWKPSTREEPPRSSLLRIAAGEWVLILDLLPVPWNQRPPQPLSDKLCKFLQDNRTFYGIRMLEDAARLSFELNCKIRGVDLRRKPWQGANTRGGFIDLGNRLLNTTVSKYRRTAMSNFEWRPLTWPQMHHMVEHSYLTWAVVDYLLRTKGPGSDDALVTDVQIWRAGQRLRRGGRALKRTRFNWGKVRNESIALLQEAREQSAKSPKKVAAEVKKRIPKDDDEDSDSDSDSSSYSDDESLVVDDDSVDQFSSDDESHAEHDPFSDEVV